MIGGISLAIIAIRSPPYCRKEQDIALTGLRVSAWHLLVAIYVVFLSGCGEHLGRHPENGVLDLRGVDFQHDVVELAGPWVATSGLVDASAFDSLPKEHAARLPSAWSKLVDGLGEPVAGREVTMRLTVLLDTHKVKQLSIDCPQQASAYELLVDGRRVLSNGRVGTSATSEIPENRYDRGMISHLSPRMTFLLRVSNHHRDEGGQLRRIVLGDPVRVHASFFWEVMPMLIAMAIMLLFAIHSLGFIVFSVQEKTNILFGIYCLLWLFAGLGAVADFNFMTMWVPSFPYEASLIGTFILVALSLLLVGLLCESMFSNPVLVWANRALMVVVAFCVAFYLFGPFEYAFRVFNFMVGLGFAEVVVLSYSLALAIRKGTAGAIPFAVGYAVFMAATAHDGFVFLGWANPPYTMIPGGAALAVAEALVLAMRFFTTVRANKQLLSQVQEKNAELGRLSHIKDEFLANTSHELRTPLHSILGMTESVLEDRAIALGSESRASLKQVVSSARRLNRLVDDILDAAKLEAGELVLRRDSVALDALAAEVLASFQANADRKGVKLLSRVDRDLTRVWVDADRLTQVLCNLVGNSLKFTDAGFVEIAARNAGERVEVSVSDTGIGVPEGDREKIFLPFEQAGGGKRGGTGLGLSICRKLVQMHGGTLRLEPRAEGGSVFLFTLPPTPHGAPPALARPASVGDGETDTTTVIATTMPSPSAEAASGWTVLAIDDERINLEIVRKILTGRGIRVVLASDGRQILDLIGEHRPGLVLLDVMMPLRDGFEVCEEIRTAHAPWELPVLFQSARSQAEDVARGFACGGNDYVFKPFVRQELIARVEAHLRQRDAYMALKSGVA
ncbi:MAG: response regulator [Fibrobacteres bacterium]|nr:response regulator [Fibrobacterota bacterium]